MPSRGRFTDASARARWNQRWEERWADRHGPAFDDIELWQARRQSGSNSRVARAARVVVPVIVSLFIQVPSVFLTFRAGHGVSPNHVLGHPATLALSLVLALIGPLSLILARRFPGPVVAIVSAAAAVDLLRFGDTNHPPYIALAFAIISAVVRGARLWAWISVAAAWVVTLSVALVFGVDVAPGRVIAATLGVLLVLGIGEGIRTRRERFAEVSRRVAERKQSEVQAERVRIARELHDVLAHSLSQINVQAGVGLHLMDRQPDKAKDALASIKETSKTALDEVRSVLGILRAEGGADPSAPLVPEPDLSRLTGLAASIAAQGVTVDVQNSLDSAPSAPAQLALYRIAQESLTNVIRHAHATAVTVRVSELSGDYLLDITDDGTGAHPTPRLDPGQIPGGRGLLGMRERAELLGGSLTAGPLPGGGFRVSARIPVSLRSDASETLTDRPRDPR